MSARTCHLPNSIVRSFGTNTGVAAGFVDDEVYHQGLYHGGMEFPQKICAVVLGCSGFSAHTAEFQGIGVRIAGPAIF